MAKNYVMVIDEGTTGTRSLIFDKSLNIIASSYTEFTQYTPASDKVEHDAMEIYDNRLLSQVTILPASVSPISAILLFCGIKTRDCRFITQAYGRTAVVGKWLTVWHPSKSAKIPLPLPAKNSVLTSRCFQSAG